MDVDDRSIAARLRELGDRGTIAPDHIAALLVLASCACAGLVILWWTARPIASPTPAASRSSIVAPSAPPSGAPAPGGAAPDGPVSGGALVGVPTSVAPAGASERPTSPPVVVHVSGAVVAAGVVELPAGSRVVDAVDAAGGFRRRARTGQLNLARVVQDGEQIHVPGPGVTGAVAGAGAAAAGVGAVAVAPGVADGTVPGAPGAGASGASGAVPDAPGSGAPGVGAPIDLNAASAAQLEILPGVGPVLSGRIVAHRDAIGGFTSVDQLLEVTGIGEKTFAALRELVVV